MSQTLNPDTIDLPSRVERKVSNRNDDSWYEYDGEQLFDSDTLRRIIERFDQMRTHDYEKIAYVKGSDTKKTKIRTKDKEDFVADLDKARQQWADEYGDRLTSFGNAYYGEVLTDYGVVEIHKEKPRKTVLWAEYDAGRRAFMGGAKGKKQNILLPIRTFEQWSYHTEVVEPLFAEYHEKYPY